MAPKLFNFIIFQVSWFSCVGFAKGLLSIESLVLFLVAILVLHYRFFANRLKLELKFHFLLSLIGLGVDALFLKWGILHVLEPSSYVLMPFWLIGMWLVFPVLFFHSLVWLKEKNKVIQALAGAFGGSLSYISGMSLGLLSFSGESSYLIVAVYWALLMPVGYALMDLLVEKS